MIALERIEKSFGERRILDDLSLEFARGQVTAVVGSSGAGKSTLLRCIDFLERPDSGRVVIGDRLDAATATRRERRRSCAAAPRWCSSSSTSSRARPRSRTWPRGCAWCAGCRGTMPA